MAIRKTPHTVVCKAIRTFSEQTGLSVKQSELLIAIYEAEWLTTNDLADLTDIRPKTVIGHLEVLYNKGWLPEPPHQMKTKYLTNLVRERYANRMRDIHRSLRQHVSTIIEANHAQQDTRNE